MKKSMTLVLLAAGVSLSSGCAGMPKSWSQKMPWAEKPSQIIDSKYQIPVKMAVLWTPAMFNKPGQEATRGFGGRLYFYNSKNEAIAVQGQLVVYGFDDTNKGSDHKQPDKRVAFTPEQFTNHFSPTELGASYSVWVPWDKVGNPQAQISLVPIFTAATGQVVIGSQSLALLPGPETPVPEKTVEEKVLSAQRTQNGDVSRVGFDEDISAPTFAPRRLQSMTITLPQSLAERVAASRNNEPRQITVPEQPLKALPQEQKMPPEGQTQNPTEAPTKGLSPESPNSMPAPEPLTHFERSQPRAPALQPPRPIGGPAPSQQPLSIPPSSHP